MPDKASAPLLQQLAATLEKDEAQRAELIGKIKVGWWRGPGMFSDGLLVTLVYRLAGSHPELPLLARPAGPGGVCD